MKLIVGLGNPGKNYENTRHNSGFMAIDAFASKYNVEFKLEPKFKGMLASVVINGKKALLLKPQTYMNLSGEAIRPVMQFYKIDVDDILIISDDLDSHTGRVRIRATGSPGGHNGHKSIVQNIGTDAYKRIKLGIGRSEQISVVDWVLMKFNEDDMALMNNAIAKSVLAIEDFINEIDFSKIASAYSEK